MPPRSRIVAVLLAFLAAHATASLALAQDEPGAERPHEMSVAPVELDGDVLFSVRGIRAYPAETRAADIAERIRQAARDPKVAPDQIHAVETDERTEIRAGDTSLLFVLDADAELEDITRQDMALAYLRILAAAIERYRAARTREQLLIGAARTALSTALIAAFLILLRLVFRRLDGLAIGRFERRIQALEARSYEIVRAERVRGLIRGTLRTLRAVLAVVAVYVYLQHTLALFPWTRPVAVRLASWLVDPLRAMWQAFVDEVPDLIFLAILGVVVHYALRALRLFFDGIGRGTIRFEGFDTEWAAPTYKIARVAVVAFALVVAYPYIPGSGSEAFKGISLFMGVVFSLGSSSVIGNMIAGLAMTYRRAFKVGDRVKIGDVIGEVSAVRLQVTHLRTPKNEEVVVPNSTVLNNQVINYSTLARTKGLILHTTVGIGYEVPWRQVEAMLLLAADRTPGLQKDPPPFVLQQALGDFAVVYELNAYCPDPGSMWTVYSDLHRSIQDVFNEYGVQIMTPAYESDTPEPKVVPREQWFAAPARPPDSAGEDRPRPNEAAGTTIPTPSA